eukprot:10002145-Karenia_brevis.AAC.1
MNKKYRCMQCCLQGRGCMKSPEAFGIYKPSDLMPKLWMHGMWTRCQSCSQGISESEPRISDSNDDALHRRAAEEAAFATETDAKKMQCTKRGKALDKSTSALSSLSSMPRVRQHISDAGVRARCSKVQNMHI